MQTSHEKLAALLKKQGLSVTKPRLAVFQALIGKDPLTMHELVTQVTAIDRASVYRTIDLFEKLGVVIRINIGWKYKIELSDAFLEHHHHLSCTSCGKTVAMNETELEHAIDRLSNLHGFVPFAHQIEIQGTCNDCLKKNQR
jgi:Fur family ferric uptake transcriptional regulator